METKTKNPQNNYQILIKLLNGKHQTLNFKSPILPIQTLKHQIQTLTSIPPPLQLLTFPNSRIIDESTSLACDTSPFPVIVHLLLRLRGGKGGFGSLLRGAGTKAGQKKTNNFDACRDMSGRRLRHVNAEKKLEEWKTEADERKLEKMAEDYLKKKEKEVGKKRKNGKGEDAERYVAKYREDSAKCMEEVERTVRESLKGVLTLKRKGGNGGSEDADAKRMKIWMGKRLADSDSDSDDMDDDSEDDDDEEKEKSAVVDNGNNSGLTEEAYRSPDSVTDTQLGSVSSENVTSASETETEKQAGPEENPCSAKIVDDGEDRTSPNDVPSSDAFVESGSESLKLENVVAINSENDVPSTDALVESGSESIKLENVLAIDPDNDQPTVGKKPSTSDLHEDLVAQVNAASGSKSPSTETEVLNFEKPLSFDDYNSAAEMEVLGMERLKSELQERGLKCGGTLQERAARLFLLKTTPLEKLPKKLFAKK